MSLCAEKMLKSRLLTIEDVADMLRVSVATVHRLRSDHQFPRPLVLGKRTTRWRESDVAEYLESLCGGSNEH
jgi:prophage regulatory protein